MTIDTSREAVERLLDGVTPGPWAASEHQWPDQVGCCPLVGRPFSAHKNMLNVAAANTKADIHFIAAARDLVPALLAERDAALAEVARLSTPPDHLALVAAAYRDAAGLPAFDCTGDPCGTFDGKVFVKLDAILTRTPADAEAHLTALLRAEYERGKAEAQVQGDTFYILEWMAGARPPVHPNPMRGRQSFRTPKEAIAFFKRQASDAQFLSLTKRVFLTEDCTPQALALLTQEGR